MGRGLNNGDLRSADKGPIDGGPAQVGHMFADGVSPADAWLDPDQTVAGDKDDQTFLLVSAKEGAPLAGEVPQDGPFPDGWLESTYRSSGDALMFDYNRVTGGSALESPAVGRERTGVPPSPSVGPLLPIRTSSRTRLRTRNLHR